MECITRIDQLSDWMNLTCRRDIITNCYLGPKQYQKYVGEKSLYLLNEAKGCFLFHDLESYYQMYYCIEDAFCDFQQNSCNRLLLDETGEFSGNSKDKSFFLAKPDRAVVADILYKEKSGQPKNVLTYLERLGFKSYIKRSRMSVKNQDFKKNLDMYDSTDSRKDQNIECTSGLAKKLDLSSGDEEENQYTIRLATAADARQALNLITQSFDPYTSCIPGKDEFFDIISQSNVLVACYPAHDILGVHNKFTAQDAAFGQSEKIAGVFHFQVEKSVAYVNHLVVAAEARGKGLAGKLLAAGRTICDRGEKPYWRLWVRQDNPAAQDMYLKYGFQFDGTCCLSVLNERTD